MRFFILLQRETAKKWFCNGRVFFRTVERKIDVDMADFTLR